MSQVCQWRFEADPAGSLGRHWIALIDGLTVAFARPIWGSLMVSKWVNHWTLLYRHTIPGSDPTCRYMCSWGVRRMRIHFHGFRLSYQSERTVDGSGRCYVLSFTMSARFLECGNDADTRYQPKWSHFTTNIVPPGPAWPLGLRPILRLGEIQARFKRSSRFRESLLIRSGVDRTF